MVVVLLGGEEVRARSADAGRVGVGEKASWQEMSYVVAGIGYEYSGVGDRSGYVDNGKGGGALY